MSPEKAEQGESPPENSEELAQLAARLLLERKGEDVVILGMREVLPLTDYFVIATGRNPRHVDALVELLQKRMKELGVPLIARSGRDTKWWVLLDFGSVVVHVFRAEARDYYDLEMLWGDAKRIEIP